MRLTFRRSVLAVAATSLVLSAGVAAFAQQGIAERVGNALDNTGRAIKNGVQTAFTRSRDKVHTMALLDRVYSRLHWDKALTTSALEIEVRDGGVAVLRGVVPDEKAKAVAVDLARNTVGVAQVVDQLSVSEAAVIGTPAPVIEPAPDRPLR